MCRDTIKPIDLPSPGTTYQKNLVKGCYNLYTGIMTKRWLPHLDDRAIPTYMAVLEALRTDIVAGRLLPGDRLPTHRDLAGRLGVAVGTVTRAYQEAERQGLIFGDGRRGTFVGNPPADRDRQPGGPTERAYLIDLSRFFPPAGSDPDLGAALSALAQRRDIQHLMRYTRADGYDYHRAAGARWLGGLGLKATPDDLVITSGAQHAIFSVLLAAGKRGDVIATDLHTYPGIRFAAEHLGLEVVGIEGDDDGMDPDALASCCAGRSVRFLYLVPTYQNPTNTVLSESRRHAIAGIAEKYGVDIIEDEINRKLLPDPPPLIKSIVPERCYLIATLAKLVAGGLRICYVAPPGERRDELLAALHTTALMVSPLLGEIAAVWINDGTADRVIAEKRHELERRNKAAAAILRDFDFRGWPTSYFIWLRLPAAWRLARFQTEAEQARIIVAPSTCFAIDKNRQANAVRLCLGGLLDIDTLKASLTSLVDVLRGQGSPESVVL
jgi:DNA-binding transcriptional MocR family regulator